MNELRLEVNNFRGPGAWQWVLRGSDGAFLDTHDVRLDVGCWQYEAFTNLTRYLRLHAPPHRRIEEEARILARVGTWIGKHVFGSLGIALVKARPAVVRVVVPDEAAELIFLPLELAHVDGQPLALHDVIPVMQRDGRARVVDMAPTESRLRVLGLFSVPEGERPLNLRREREALVRIFSESQRKGLPVNARVLQYGVTRAELADIFAEPEGWDVVHISGHGSPGELLLETEDGSPDPIGGAELVQLVSLAQTRLKLVTVSACWSAAVAQRQLLGLSVADQPEEEQTSREATEHRVRSLATDLADLGCAVLAMRYPVTDEFAIALARGLYGRLTDGTGVSLPQALAAALRAAVAVPPNIAYPALSVASPALFGSLAAKLQLVTPLGDRAQPYDGGTPAPKGLPPNPERFVGRTGVMAQASAALAPRSGTPGLLLHGMPGGGKTACALELVSTHRHAFDTIVWFKAPDDGRETTDALHQFALALEPALSNLRMAHVLESEDELARFLPELTRECAQERVLIVVDNVESLLTRAGQWRDLRWAMVIEAIYAHAGVGRMILTSRRRLGGLDARMRVLPVGALSLDESLLLARELPNLSKLLDGAMPGIEHDAARGFARNILEITQGHPKLLELIDGQAADPNNLRRFVEQADAAWQQGGGLPIGFLATGEPHAAAGDYFHVLTAWTGSIAEGLREGDRDLFGFLSCLNEDDRIPSVIELTWPHLCNRLGKPVTPSGLHDSLAALSAVGLTTAPPASAAPDMRYEIHPTVAATGRNQAGNEFQQAVDLELAAYWSICYGDAQEREAENQGGALIVRAANNAARYLLRLGKFADAAGFLESVLYRDLAPTTAWTVLPLLRKIADAAAGTPDEHHLTYSATRALEKLRPGSTMYSRRTMLTELVARGDYGHACAAADGLARYFLRSGQVDQALKHAEESIRYARLGGLGAWTELSGEAVRLQVRSVMGYAQEVFDAVQDLRKRMDGLPLEAGVSNGETGAQPFDVRERLLDAGRHAAVQLELWQEAVDLSAAAVASMRARGAPDTEVIRARFGIHGPLIHLGRQEEALALLADCREVAEKTRDTELLGQVLGALGHIEHERGHGEAAVSLTRDALYYAYSATDTETIWLEHGNLGAYLHAAGEPEAALAHHLAAAVICKVAGRGQVHDWDGEVARDLAVLGDAAPTAIDAAELCRQAAEVQGVDLCQHLTRLGLDANAIEQALEDSFTRARTRAAVLRARQLALWDPVIAALVSAHRGNANAAAALERHLARDYFVERWPELAAALRQLLAGEYYSAIQAELHPADRLVVSEALNALAGKVTIRAQLWPAMDWAPLLSITVAVALGDKAVAQRAHQLITTFTAPQYFEALGHALHRILEGDRDPNLVMTVGDPTSRAIVATVLTRIAAPDERTLKE